MQRFSKYMLMFSLLLSAAVSWAGPVTQQIPFTTTTMLAVPDTYTFRFSLWDLETGGTAGADRVWWEIKEIDMTTKTLTTNLGSVTKAAKRSGRLADLDFSEQYWVQVERLGADGKTWNAVGTRTKFTVVPYAMWSAQGGDAISVTAGDGLTGTTTPDGDITLNVGAGPGIIVSADRVSIAGSGVTSTMLAANAVTDGKIALPYSGSGNVGNMGVVFSMTNSASPGIAIKGIVTGTTGAGVVGEADNGSDIAGVLGHSTAGVGVVGVSETGFAGIFHGNAFFSSKVGLGTYTPSARFHLIGAGYPDSFIFLDTLAAGQDSGIRFHEKGTVKSHLFYDSASGNLRLYGSNFIGIDISSSGNVGVGTTTPGGYKLYVSGNAYTTGTWGGSDVRWKKNIATLESSLEKVLQLRGVSYDWKTEEYPDKGFTKERQIGFIAQEVEPILPEVVKTDSDGYKALAYDRIAAVLVEAIKEQQSQIEVLKARIEALENR